MMTVEGNFNLLSFERCLKLLYIAILLHHTWQ